MSEYSWKDVAAHNTADSLWVYADDKVYDITPWLERHPGGKKLLLLAAGRDVTDLLLSYHPFAIKKVKPILAKYEVGRINEAEFPRYKKDSGFYTECCKRVGQHFDDTQKDPKGALPGLIRMFFTLIVWVVSILYVYDRSNPFYLRLLAAVIYGVTTVIPLLHVMHDSSHTSLSHSPWFWHFVGRFTMDFMNGTCITSWYHQHILGHHLYTNVLGVDPDLPTEPTGDIRRVMPKQLWNWIYKFQYLYLPPLYGLLGLKVRLQDIKGTLIDHQSGKIRMNPFETEVYIRQILSKLLFFMWRIIVPLYFLQMEILEFLVLFTVTEFVSGFYLSINFQVSHISPNLNWPSTAEDPSGFEGEWAVEQVQTSVDYSHGNPVATFLCGALNYQTVHHLFPSVSQYHYPAIAPIVMEVCKEYNIQFNRLPDFSTAFTMHLQQLKDMGEKQPMH